MAIVLYLVWLLILPRCGAGSLHRSLRIGVSKLGGGIVDDAVKMYELQRVDLTWTKVARRLQQLQQLLGESDELRTARQQVAQTQTELHEWHAKQKNAELEDKSLAERIKATEDRMMSGAVRNPKELEALQQSLEALRRHREMVEEEGVKAMGEAEALAAKLVTAQAALASIENGWNGNQSELREEETKLKQNGFLLKRKREQLTAAMNETLRDRYETMRKRKAGVAISTVQNGTCSACHVALPTGVVNGLRGATSLVICPSCGRYLAPASS
jgi:predicted  nucleic acid-binding Zn-ribbon protein